MAATADLRERAMQDFVLYGNASINELDLRAALDKHLAKLASARGMPKNEQGTAADTSRVTTI